MQHNKEVCDGKAKCNIKARFLKGRLNFEKSLAIYDKYKENIQTGQCYENVFRLSPMIEMDVVYGYIEHHMFKGTGMNGGSGLVVYRHCLFRDGEDLVCPSIVTHMTKEVFESLRMLPIAVIPKEVYMDFVEKLCKSKQGSYDVSQLFTHEPSLVQNMLSKNIVSIG